MKKSFILSVLVILLVLTGCSSGKKESASNENKEVNIKDVLLEIEKVNPVSEARAIDDFALENELLINPEIVSEYVGEITNVQSDCALVFICKSSDTKAVKNSLNEYKTSLASNNLYAEFTEKTEQADNAVITVKGDYVIMVIAGIGKDYGEISKAIDSQF